MIVLFWILHILICVLTYFLLRSGTIKTRELILPVVIFIPFFGVLLLLSEEYALRRERMGDKEIDIDMLKIKEAKYRRIDVDKGENQNITVPLEEAILVNDTKVRRKLMLDILHRNPDEYIDLLQRTRLGTDSELTHYATTTMMEIQSGFEQKLQKYSASLQKNNEDRKLLEKYGRQLEKYIKSGLISGNILMIYRNQWDGVLEKLMMYEPNNKSYWLKKIDNQIASGNYERIEERLKEAHDRWPDEEAIYQLYVNYYRSINRGDLVEALFTKMQEENIYLSHEGRQWFDFWNNKEHGA